MYQRGVAGAVLVVFACALQEASPAAARADGNQQKRNQPAIKAKGAPAPEIVAPALTISKMQDDNRTKTTSASSSDTSTHPTSVHNSTTTFDHENSPTNAPSKETTSSNASLATTHAETARTTKPTEPQTTHLTTLATTSKPRRTNGDVLAIAIVTPVLLILIGLAVYALRGRKRRRTSAGYGKMPLLQFNFPLPEDVDEPQLRLDSPYNNTTTANRNGNQPGSNNAFENPIYRYFPNARPRDDSV